MDTAWPSLNIRVPSDSPTHRGASVDHSFRSQPAQRHTSPCAPVFCEISTAQLISPHADFSEHCSSEHCIQHRIFAPALPHQQRTAITNEGNCARQKGHSSGRKAHALRCAARSLARTTSIHPVAALSIGAESSPSESEHEEHDEPRVLRGDDAPLE